MVYCARLLVIVVVLEPRAKTTTSAVTLIPVRITVMAWESVQVGSPTPFFDQPTVTSLSIQFFQRLRERFTTDTSTLQISMQPLEQAVPYLMERILG
jgi:hypothetical protein